MDKGDPLITTNTNGQLENEKNSDNDDDDGSMKCWNTLSSFIQKEELKKKEETPIRLINPQVLNYLSPFPPASTTITTTTSTVNKKKNIIKPSSSLPKPPPRKKVKKNDIIKSTTTSRAIHLPKPAEVGKNSITFYSMEVEDQVTQEESKKFIKSNVLPLSVLQMIQKDGNLKSLLNSGEITITQMIPIERENYDEIDDLIIDEDQEDSDSICYSTNSTNSTTDSSELSSETLPPVEFDLLKYSALLLEMAREAEKEFKQEVKDNLDWGHALSKNGYFTNCLNQLNSSRLMPPPPIPLLKYGYPSNSTLPTFSKYRKSNNNFNYDIDLKIKNAFQQNQSQNGRHSIYSNDFDNDEDEVGYLDLIMRNSENKNITQNGINHLNLNGQNNDNNSNETNDFDDDDVEDNKRKNQDFEDYEFENSNNNEDNNFDPNRFLELAYDGNAPEPEIGIDFGNRNNLSNMEPTPKSHTCTFCSKFFNKTADLRRHLSIHTGLKPFRCDYLNCPESFIKKSLLIEHKRKCHSTILTAAAFDATNKEFKFPQTTSNPAEIPPMPIPTLSEMKSFFTTCS